MTRSISRFDRHVLERDTLFRRLRVNPNDETNVGQLSSHQADINQLNAIRGVPFRDALDRIIHILQNYPREELHRNGIGAALIEAVLH